MNVVFYKTTDNPQVWQEKTRSGTNTRIGGMK